MNHIRPVLSNFLHKLQICMAGLKELLPFRSIPIRFDICDLIIVFQTASPVSVYDSCNTAFYHWVRYNHQYLHYFEPLPAITTTTVLNRILISSHKDQLSIYCKSYFTTSSKFSISLRPLTCHMPVSPGVMLIRRR